MGDRGSRSAGLPGAPNQRCFRVGMRFVIADGKTQKREANRVAEIPPIQYRDGSSLWAYCGEPADPFIRWLTTIEGLALYCRSCCNSSIGRSTTFSIRWLTSDSGLLPCLTKQRVIWQVHFPVKVAFLAKVAFPASW